MDKQIKIKKLNKKLLMILILMLAILGTLLTINTNAATEMESRQQTTRSNPTYLTYSDLKNYYDILCCQHYAPLKGDESVILSGWHSQGSFSYNFGELKASDKGKKVETHTIYYQGNDFNKSVYKHYTYGYYSIVENHIATPKEAYIIAEMKYESSNQAISSSYELIDSNGSSTYTGSLANAIEETLSTGETIYIVNQKYVLKTNNGAYYVSSAVDSTGNKYYIYDLDRNGHLKPYTGDYKYKDPVTGEKIDCVGIDTNNVYYVQQGQLLPGNTIASSSGTVYLIDYDIVVKTGNTYSYAHVSNTYRYIQIAWWSTSMGTSYGAIAPSAPNELSREAEAFEDYILKITGNTSVKDLKYEEQSYKFVEDGKTVSGSVKAPVIEYNPSWNEDSDQNGTINEADEVTVAFDHNTQKYIIGPFSINYVKESAHIEGRDKVDFAGITNAELVSNLGRLEFGADWNFKFLADQARDDEENYPYPNPNEVFYIEVKYVPNLTEIKEFNFGFRYMNAGAELDIYDGTYSTATWTVKHKDTTHQETYTDSNGNTQTRTKFDYRTIWLELTSLVPHDSQTLAHAIKGARWYNYKNISKEFGINQWATITIEKTTVGESGDKVPVNDTYYFDIYVDGKLFQTVSLKTNNGYGKVTSNKIIWEGAAPTYKVVEVGDNRNNGPWEGTLPTCENITVEAENYIAPNKGTLEIDKKLVNETPALRGETFHFTVKLTGTFSYDGSEMKTYTSKEPLVLDVYISEANNWVWNSGEFKWYGENAPHYKVEEVIPDGATYELVNGVVNNGAGYLENDTNKVAIATNQSTTDWTVIEVDKRMVSSTTPQPGEVFYAEVTIKGTFSYNGDAIQERELVLNVTLDESNNWKWFSEKIVWNNGNVPTYEIKETGMADGTTFVSISDETRTTNENGLTGYLQPDSTLLIITNDRPGPITHSGVVIIEKRATSPIISGEEFYFTLTINGDFTYQGQKYTTLEIKDIVITADGPVWTSDVISWEDGVDAPTYTVTEDESKFFNGVEFVSIRNATQTNTEPTITGTVGEESSQNWVIVENGYKPDSDKGRLQIYKVLVDENGNQIDGVNFTFKVTVGDNTQTITIPSGGYWRSDWYTWNKDEEAPKYHVEEINSEGYKVTIDKPDGSLVAQDSENGVSGIVEVKAINTRTEEHKAKIKINKNLILNDKVSENDVTVGFTFLVHITGDFTYNKVAYNNTTLTLKVTISKDTDWTWLSKEITWNGDKAPVFDVEEPESDLPTGWHLVSVESTPDNHLLPDSGTAVVNVTNEWDYEEDLILTMSLGGKVWDDTNRTSDKHVDALENGVIDEGEAGIENVKVTIYRALADKNTGAIVRRLDGVYAYDENNLMQRIDAVTYTDENGNWSLGAVSVPAFISEEEISAYSQNYIVTYDVEFEYDGQTYEPTEFLATAGGSAESYVGATAINNMYNYVANKWSTLIKATTSERDKYLYDSMAIDDSNQRNSFNNSFATITGEEAMDNSGNTLGLAIGTDGGRKDLHYTSVDSVSLFNGDNTRKISKLQTTDSNGYIYDELKMNAATSNANLTFPFYTDNPLYDTTVWHLIGWDKTITDCFKMTYKFEAIYNYCLSINLGLVEREATDVAIEKDLTEAIVVVNGKALKYRFNSAIDLDNPNNYELLYKQIAVADANIEYKLGLYDGDYYYRAAVYNGSETGEALESFYTKVLNLPVESSEMEIYLKYTLKAHNESETYDVTIGSISDYFDSSFELIETDEYRYVQTLNGKEINNAIVVASPSTVTYYTAGVQEKGTSNVSWTKAQNIEGSDGITYTKITSNSIANEKLATGETANISVTFKVTKDNVGASGILNAVKLGEKHNVAEITSFTSYYSDQSENRWSEPGQITGRVDEDSAPNNINIIEYNDKTYYEDDTDSAPIITIGLNNENRTISGIAWDDAQSKGAGYGQKVGNGIFNPDEGDKLVNGLTVELYESISIPTLDKDENGKTVYKEYQFAWPTDEPIAELGNKTISEITGFNQRAITKNGEYTFIGMPTGNYKVRFVYGDKLITTGKSGSEEIYSGHDYKSTAYQPGFDNDSDNDGYLDNEWHDLTNSNLSASRVNDARDDEARRLYISAKTEMLTFDNTNVLATADNKDVGHEELFGNYNDVRNNPVTGEGYYMYAETAKINLGVENIYKIGYTTETLDGIDIGSVQGSTTQNGKNIGTSEFVYNIKNVDFGLEERSQTKLTLDKQIKEITLTTSDGRIILDAIYDINYELGADGSIKSTVTLNEQASTGINNIASLNRSGSNQGYRYIMADSEILQGTVITVKYQLTVFNMSETDRINKVLEELWDEYNAIGADKASIMENALAKVSTPLYTESKGRVYKDGSNFIKSQYGSYFGSIYYLGAAAKDIGLDKEPIVKTKVHNMIDYIDPDIEFTDTNNISKDQSWTNVEIEYLLDNKLIDPKVVQIIDKDGNITGRTALDSELAFGERYSIVSDKYQEYLTDTKNNIITNIDNYEETDTATNPGFVKFLEPYMTNSNYNNSTATMRLETSRFYSSELDTSDIDNIAEIIKVENTAGRRDARTIAGNLNPFAMKNDEPIGVFASAKKEPDSSATEVITLTPPTGLEAAESRTTQLILVVLISVTLVAVAIIIIKKKVLIKR